MDALANGTGWRKYKLVTNVPNPDTSRIRGHHGQRRRTVEHRVPRLIRLHDGVAVPQHVEPGPLGVPPAPSQSIQRQVRVLIGAEAQSGHAAPQNDLPPSPALYAHLANGRQGQQPSPLGCPEHNITDLTTLVKTRLRRMQYRPGLLDGFSSRPAPTQPPM